jgi:hypothetical protein
MQQPPQMEMQQMQPGQAPAPGYGAPPPGQAPAPGYGAPPPAYGAPPPAYGAAYGAPPPANGAPPPGMPMPSQQNITNTNVNNTTVVNNVGGGDTGAKPAVVGRGIFWPALGNGQVCEVDGCGGVAYQVCNWTQKCCDLSFSGCGKKMCMAHCKVTLKNTNNQQNQHGHGAHHN